ncbi:MAG: diacylglycerol kinase [Burkholderiaceae bacterium]
MSDHSGGGFAGLMRRRLAGGLSYSVAGLRRGWFEEAFRVELALSVVLVPLAIWLGDNPIERVLLLGSILLVLIAELLNTAIEEAIDRISVERHPRSKDAKDLGSAAVFLAMMGFLLTWGLILLT